MQNTFRIMFYLLSCFFNGHEERVVRNYLRYGGEFGTAVSLMCIGKVSDFNRRLNRYAAAEIAFAGLGYRTLSLDFFVKFGARGVKADDVLLVRRGANEKSTLHAEAFRSKYSAWKKSAAMRGSMIRGER